MKEIKNKHTKNYVVRQGAYVQGQEEESGSLLMYQKCYKMWESKRKKNRLLTSNENLGYISERNDEFK